MSKCDKESNSPELSVRLLDRVNLVGVGWLSNSATETPSPDHFADVPLNLKIWPANYDMEVNDLEKN